MSDDRPPRSSLVDAVLSILEALAEGDLDDRERSRSAGRFRIDSDVSVGSLADRPSGSPGTPRPSKSPEMPERSGMERSGTERSETSDVHTTVRETETGYQVTADLPSETGGEDVTAEVEDGTIVLYTDGQPIERVPVSFEEVRVTGVTVTNRVVEVTLERTEGAS